MTLLKNNQIIKKLKSKHANKMLPATKQSGFSLVEIMVGLVVGLLATLVIVNVLTVFEKQKRATTGNSDAQTNGAIALYNLQRDIQLAGYGLPVYDTEFTPYKCGTENNATAANITTYDHDKDPVTAAIGLSPIVLIDGAAGATDTLAVRTGNTATGGISVVMRNIIGSNTAVVDTNMGCRVDDTALMVSTDDNARCRMRRVIGAVAGGTDIVFSPNLDGADNIVAGHTIACLGPWNEYRYTVNANRELTRSGAVVAGIPSANAVPVVSDIVSLQAQYGISDPASPPSSTIVTQWVDATGADWNNINNVDNRNRIKAVRVAIVARSGQIETAAVTAACSSLTAAEPTGLCAWAGTAGSPAPMINLAATDADWARYRYRVYESIIPMRNIIWSGAAL